MRLKLQTRLLLPILGIVFLSLVLSLYFVVNIAEKAILHNGKQGLQTTAFTVERAAEEQISRAGADIRITSALPLLRDVLVNINLPQNNEVRATAITKSNALLKSIADIYGYYESYYMTNSKGLVTTSFEPSVINTLDISNRAWFHNAMREGGPLISDPFTSRLTGLTLIAVIVRMEEGGNRGGMVGSIRIEQMMQNVFNQTRDAITETMLIDGKGLLVAKHAQSQLKHDVFKNATWLGELEKEPHGFIEAKVDGVDTFIAYNRMPGTKMFAVAMTARNDLLAPAKRISSIGLGILAGGLLLSCLVIVLTVAPLVRVLRSLGGFAEAIGRGDFAVPLEVNRSDELGTMADSLRKMATNLKSMIGTAEAKTAEAVEQSALAQKAQQDAERASIEAENAKRQGILHAVSQLSTIIEEAVLQIETLQGVVNEAARGASLQQKTTGEASQAIASLNHAVGQVLDNANQASDVAQKTIENADAGAGIVESVTESISKVNAQVQGLRESTQELDRSVSGITSTLGIISDIADQTNLLALNAAIEAARAGDAGRGFAVVADEVRKLADKTMIATKEISSVVHNIQDKTLRNTEGMDTAAASVDETVKLATVAADSLDEIVRYVGSSASMVASIATASRQQSEMSGELERGSAEIREVAAANTELMTEAGEAVRALDDVAKKIQQLIIELQQ